jgi:serine/threonine-protein kinase PknK
MRPSVASPGREGLPSPVDMVPFPRITPGLSIWLRASGNFVVMAMVLVGRFEIRGVAGRGQQGTVLHAYDRAAGLGATAARALKVVPKEDRAAGAALLAEASRLLAVSSAALPHVFEIGELPVAIEGLAAGSPMVVMQWIEGQALARVAPLALPALLACARDVALGLAALHGHGVLHRDVSPANVVLRADGAAALVDLGLSTPGRDGSVRGTLAYLAPEALAGSADDRSDLYALGATLWFAVRGHAPVGGATAAEVVRAILQQPRAVLDELPPSVRGLIADLLTAAPSARPVSAASVAQRLERIADALGVVLPPMPAARATVVRPRFPDVERVAVAFDAPTPTLLHARPGHDVRGLIEHAARVHQATALGVDTPAAQVGSPHELAARWGLPPLADGGAAVAQVLAARQGPVALLLDAEALAAARAAVALAPPRSGLVLAVEHDGGPPAAALDGDMGLLAPVALSPQELAAWTEDVIGQAPPPAWIDALAEVTSGRPGAVAAALEEALRRPEPLARPPSAAAGHRAAAVEAWWARRPPGAELALVLAAFGGDASDELVMATTGPAGMAGLAEVTQLGLRGPIAGPLLERVRAMATTAQRRRVAAAAWRAAQQLGDVVAGGRAAAWLEPAPARDDAVLAAIDALLTRGDAARARDLASSAVTPGRAAALGRLAARAAMATGDLDAAVRHARAHDAPLLAGVALRRLGRLDEAAAELSAWRTRSTGLAQRQAAGALARVAIARGAIEEAAAALADDVPGPDDLVPEEWLEAAALTSLYAGDLDAAERWLARSPGTEVSAGWPARQAALAAMLAQRRGEIELATTRYAEAAAHAARAGDVLASAVAAANQGIAMVPAGRSAAAIDVLGRAARALAALSAPRELASALFNRGTALLCVGELAAARAIAERAIAAAPDGVIGAAYAPLLLADLDRLAGARPAARARAAAVLAAAQEPEVRLAAAIAGWQAGAPTPAFELAASWAASDEDRDALTVADARRRLLTPADLAPAHAAAVEAAALRAHAAGRHELAWRADAVASQLWRQLGDAAAARTAAQRAVAAHDQLIAGAPPEWRTTMLTDRDRPTPPAPASAPATDASAELAHARRLIALSRRLHGAAMLEPLLGEVIDAAIELAQAERGFLVLADPDGGQRVAVARNLDAAELGRQGGFSRTITQQALTTREAVMTIDAGDDGRFEHAGSIVALRLRSVLAVPLLHDGAAIGCVYVDHRLRRGAFDDDAALRLADLAAVAAVAIANAQAAARLRERTAAAAQLQDELALELAARDAELARARAAAPTDRARLRHAYASIVGTSPALVAMLARIDRAAASALPVVLIGESGTGKELVARALHEHGARADRPFVAINCGALPDTLLESELFGHARGAFTGADRERPGLFEIADGGTLLLDEVADTSPAMQGRLLRVLQEGKVRRVGEARERPVDVRVIAATQRGLTELVRAGRFRDDLRFRIEVLTIEIPPLRERVGDLPVLTAALLGRIAPGRDITLSRSAQRALARHPWPGNVRELENALARAVAMGGDVLELGDLPDDVIRSAGERQPSPGLAVRGDLQLRPAVDELERAYIDAAMARAGGNQSQAARLLGLSRFGLQKKMRRLAAEEPDE